ncbi:hypothetical protein A6769_23825 [Nostoc punctiforme NIES-2108]|uniref:Uncharacterized protein n=1 Tax=Nostoc punctiforme NIES-2108 TaxID=1356359 RepID=A0A367RD61_NOSPU|nr:hypothetical protein A6769_23825 [Nostoc punctiforme NIES-2108]
MGSVGKESTYVYKQQQGSIIIDWLYRYPNILLFLLFNIEKYNSLLRSRFFRGKYDNHEVRFQEPGGRWVGE